MLSDRTLPYAEEVTTALLGLDALYRAENDNDRDGLVVLDMSTDHAPERFTSYDDALQRFTALKDHAGSLPEPDRKLYYRQLCESKLAFITWRQGNLPFENQISDLLHVPATPASDTELNDLRGQMRTLLNGMNYDGDLASQCQAWEERHRVPADEVPGVLNGLLDEAWDRTVQRMEIPAPRSDGMRIAAVSGVPFNARCNYLKRTVELNVDPVLTHASLKHLAVHECYPGHYVQFKLRETWFRDGTAPADGLLSVVNTASSCTFEGIADNGMQVLDWIESDDDRLMALMNRYRAGIATSAAWQLHARSQSLQQVTDWLRAQSFIGGEGWIANRMGFIAAPERCALIWSYWHGESSVTPVWERVPRERQPEFLRYLYGRLHSPQSVTLFPG